MPAARAMASIETRAYPRSRITLSAASISCSRRWPGGIRGAYGRRRLAGGSERGALTALPRLAEAGSAPPVAPARSALEDPVQDVLAPVVGAEQAVARGDDAHVRLGVGATLDQAGLAQHCDDWAILGLEPQEGGLLAAEQFSAALRRSEAPSLDGLGQLVVVVRVGQDDLRPRVCREGDALEEHSLVALERKVGELDRVVGVDARLHVGHVGVD